MPETWGRLSSRSITGSRQVNLLGMVVMNAVFSTYDAAKRVGVAQPQVVKAIQVRRIRPLKEYASLDDFAADWERNVLSRKDVGHIEVGTEGKTLNQLRAEREVIARDLALLELQERKNALRACFTETT